VTGNYAFDPLGPATKAVTKPASVKQKSSLKAAYT
jgi:hypothetical protein